MPRTLDRLWANRGICRPTPGRRGRFQSAFRDVLDLVVDFLRDALNAVDVEDAFEYEVFLNQFHRIALGFGGSFEAVL